MKHGLLINPFRNVFPNSRILYCCVEKCSDVKQNNGLILSGNCTIKGRGLIFSKNPSFSKFFLTLEKMGENKFLGTIFSGSVLKLFGYFNFLERFDKVARFYIVEFIDIQTAFITIFNLFYILFKTFQRTEVPGINYNSVADDSYF